MNSPLPPSRSKKKEMTDNQVKILTVLVDSDREFGYTYATLEDWTGLKREVLKPDIKILRELGLVEHMVGLMDDDGNVAGSGFNIVYGKQLEIRKLLERYPKPIL